MTMTKTPEIRSLPAEFRDLDADDTQMKVAGVLNVPNAESAPLNGKNGSPFIETILPDAFTKAISNSPQIDLLAQHDPTLLLASTDNDSLDLTQDDNGNIDISANLANTQPAKDTFAMVKDGLMGGLSFGMYVNNCEWGIASDGETPLRIITDLDIFEVSIVRHPAYDSTTIETRNISGVNKVDVPDLKSLKGEENKLEKEKNSEKEPETRSKDNPEVDQPETEKKDNSESVDPKPDEQPKSTEPENPNPETRSKDDEVETPDSKNDNPEKEPETRDDGTNDVPVVNMGKVASIQDVFNAAYSAISMYNSWSPFSPGDTVKILVNHMGMTNMKGAQGIVEAVNGNAYIVGYQPTDGSDFVDGHRWFTADELQYSWLDIDSIGDDLVTSDDFDDIDPYGEYRSLDKPQNNADYTKIAKAKILLKQNSNSNLMDFFNNEDK